MLCRVLRLALLIATSCGAPAAPAPPPPAAPAPPRVASEDPGDIIPAAPDPVPQPAPPAPRRDTHRVLSIRPVGGELELVVEGGARAGIRKEWSATLIDAGDRVVPIKLRIATVAEDRTVVVARATRDQVTGARVRLSPPD